MSQQNDASKQLSDLQKTLLVGTPTGNQDPLDVMAMFISWMTGETKQTPQEIKQLYGGMVERVDMAVMYAMSKRLANLPRLVGYLTSLEDELLDPNNINKMNPEEMERRYDLVSRRSAEIVEATRRYVESAGDRLKNQVDPHEALLDRLRSVPVDRLKKLVDSLEDDLESGFN
jgi:hypothetical protein